MSKTSDKPEVKRCHHCGHEWEPRVKNPKKCPQCQNPLWVSPRPKMKRKPPTHPVEEAAPTPTEASEAAAPTLPTTDTSGEADLPDASGADMHALRPLTAEVVNSESFGEPEPETPLQRARREAEERLRRLADAPID